MKEPWEVPTSQLVSYAETIPQHEHIIPAATGGSEAELHEQTLRARRAQTKPPFVKHFPVGSWGIDSTGELMQLREFEFSDPRLIFIEGFPKNQFVDLYAEWIRAGHEPPPMRALETEKGNIKIQEGHHRAAALKQVGRTKFLAWVSITQDIYGLTHKRAVQQALEIGKTVPAEVLADYSDIAMPIEPWQLTQSELLDAYDRKIGPLVLDISFFNLKFFNDESNVQIRVPSNVTRSLEELKELEYSMRYGFIPKKRVSIYTSSQGKMGIADGTHRVMIAKKLGFKKIPIELTPSIIDQNGHQNFVTYALKLGKSIPHKVLAEYPNLHQHIL